LRIFSPTAQVSGDTESDTRNTRETLEKPGFSSGSADATGGTVGAQRMPDSAELTPKIGVEVVSKPRKGFGAIFRVDPLKGCWLWQRSLDKDGYGYFRSHGKIIRAHCYYYEAKFGRMPEGLLPDHICRNRACVNPDHIEPVPHVENCRRGALVTTGMTLDKARAMRRLHRDGTPYKQLMKMFGVGKSLVAQIVTGRCWKESPSPTEAPHA
jgi:hypothetical protein